MTNDDNMISLTICLTIHSHTSIAKQKIPGRVRIPLRTLMNFWGSDCVQQKVAEKMGAKLWAILVP